MLNLQKINFAAAIVLGLACATTVYADDMTDSAKNAAKADYKQSKHMADDHYKAEKAKCDQMSGNQKDVCVKESKAARDEAHADAEAMQKSSKAQADANHTARKAEYKVAKEKCNSLEGDAKDACQAQAKSNFYQ